MNSSLGWFLVRIEKSFRFIRMPSAFRKYSRAFIRRADGTELDVGDVVEVKEETQSAIADKSAPLIAAHEQLKRLGLLGENDQNKQMKPNLTKEE